MLRLEITTLTLISSSFELVCTSPKWYVSSMMASLCCAKHRATKCLYILL